MAVVTNAALPERWVSLARLLRKPEARGEGRDDDHAGDAGGAPETCVSGACGRSVSPAPKCPIYRPDRHRPARGFWRIRRGWGTSLWSRQEPRWHCLVGARSPAGGGDRRAGPTFGSGSAQGLTSRTTVSLALAPDGSVHVALKRTSTPPPAEVACPAPMEQPSAPPDARNWLMAPCIACSNAPN